MGAGCYIKDEWMTGIREIAISVDRLYVDLLRDRAVQAQMRLIHLDHVGGTALEEL